PLNGVKGMLQLAQMKTCEPKTAEYLDYANQSADHLLDLINDVLDLSKIEAGKLEARHRPLSLRGVVRPCVEPFAVKAADKGVDLVVTVEENVPDNLRGDAGHLRQVLMNVLGNAVKFTDHGRVELRVARDPESSPDSRLKVLFQVRDTGIGIPRDKLETIFESFEQAHSSDYHSKYGGTGLGLAISKRLLELMGGEIRVESLEGEGSTFSFTVVFKAAEPSAEAPAALHAEQEQGRPLRILVAEDSKMNQIYILDLLESLGHSPVLAETGREAIRKLAKGHFDLVLMDIRMPEMDGAEATRIIRNEPPEGIDPTIPVVALTAHAFTNEIEGYMQDGFTAYLTKPIEIEKLKKTLAKL
ncbi:MAG: response regulator, partial [Desulfohalobiaceae bacterium]|nr:response regulator [Desulfohalobiaceae bacterium]